MPIKEKIITNEIETGRLPKTLRRSRRRAFCLVCGARVELVSIPQAAEICRTTQYEIQRLAGKGEIHRLHNSAGSVMICRNSLEEAKENLHNAPTIILKPLEHFR